MEMVKKRKKFLLYHSFNILDYINLKNKKYKESNNNKILQYKKFYIHQFYIDNPFPNSNDIIRFRSIFNTFNNDSKYIRSNITYKKDIKKSVNNFISQERYFFNFKNTKKDYLINKTRYVFPNEYKNISKIFIDIYDFFEETYILEIEYIEKFKHEYIPCWISPYIFKDVTYENKFKSEEMATYDNTNICFI
jgi:hypothetical protein